MHKALASSSNIINLIFKFEKILKKNSCLPCSHCFHKYYNSPICLSSSSTNNDWTPSTTSFAFWSSHPTPLSLSRWDCLWFIWTHSSSKWKTLGFCPLTAKCLGWGPVLCVMGEWFQNSRMTRLIHLGNCPGLSWRKRIARNQFFRINWVLRGQDRIKFKFWKPGIHTAGPSTY